MKEQKIALVTGGNRGIGYAITQGLLAKEYQVIITSRSLDGGWQRFVNFTVISPSKP